MQAADPAGFRRTGAPTPAPPPGNKASETGPVTDWGGARGQMALPGLTLTQYLTDA